MLIRKASERFSFPTITGPNLHLQLSAQAAEATHCPFTVGYMPKIASWDLGGLFPAPVRARLFNHFTKQSKLILEYDGPDATKNTRPTKINLDRIQYQQETFVFNTNLSTTQHANDVRSRGCHLQRRRNHFLRASIKKAMN